MSPPGPLHALAGIAFELAMARVGVAHTDLTAKGGGEAVGTRAIEALQREGHDVRLLSLTDPDLGELNRYFDAEVDPLPVQTPSGLEARFARAACRRQRYNLKNALLNRHVARHADGLDLVVGTDNELSVDADLVQYVHTPRFARLVVSKRVGEDSFVDHAYDRACYRLGGYDAEEIRESRLLANSAWIADVVQDAYGVRPHVVHPPVDVSDLAEGGLSWEERENGFLAVGRLAPYKNLETVIEIVDRVRRRGHDVHLHLVGPAHDENYAREIQAMARGRPHVAIEGELPRERVLELMRTHRYGLHGKRHEHFGIVVAEMAAAGAAVFVPDNGGQREIVDGREELTYSTADEAVETIDRVLSDPSLQREVQSDPDRVQARYGVERFRRELVDHVEAELDGQLSRPSAAHTSRAPARILSAGSDSSP